MADGMTSTGPRAADVARAELLAAAMTYLATDIEAMIESGLAYDKPLQREARKLAKRGHAFYQKLAELIHVGTPNTETPMLMSTANKERK